MQYIFLIIVLGMALIGLFYCFCNGRSTSRNGRPYDHGGGHGGAAQKPVSPRDGADDVGAGGGDVGAFRAEVGGGVQVPVKHQVGDGDDVGEGQAGRVGGNLIDV